ncbi:hypothetical protein COX69_03095 [Candidatus Falkowbacteria bacterium CG_4_10_14_0_2_um_filter_48_10]|uniref:Uncharacterized protein n=1 Tax=Candidatus Falkowbacteria bacterium CG23_combo_of_CG06-09_8_20_14_all_49_15 TaxID=1974572 RepID=A0A2G9ZMD3_9BACT|nr:MAG: hypothetical protein COX22_02735 [Candidatus Falkowbacteria bacterium CG23_combo_of_CG06-09_8_20_14_all_49_15]PJA08117.1 MAG: hypothetical protein COX69_03095 [Candidatus Falkowbacteria bacterium CG_4_10_14_0_2_um_filter_48_10]
MKIIDGKITIDELKIMAEKMFGDLVKAVVDVEKGLIALDAEMHADEEELLLEQGSQQCQLWGINLYPGKKGEDFVEFDSMINLRPAQGNRSRGVDDPDLRTRIIKIVDKSIANGIPA